MSSRTIQSLGRPHLLYRWDERYEPSAAWGQRVAKWLRLCEAFDARLSNWVTAATDDIVPSDPESLTLLLEQLGGRWYGGARVEGALSLHAHSDPPGLASIGFYVGPSHVDSATLEVLPELLSEKLPAGLAEIMEFVGDSATTLGARWAAWRFEEQSAAQSDQQASLDHAGWITYYDGMQAEHLRRLRPPAVGETRGNGIVVASATSLIGESGTSLVRAGSQVERCLFGRLPTA